MANCEASIDHAAEARKGLAFALDNDTAAGARLDYMRAQTEATLALVEQQRIANRIAIAEAVRREVEHDPENLVEWIYQGGGVLGYFSAEEKEGLGL